MSEELNCAACGDRVSDEDFVILCVECTDSIQFTLNAYSLSVTQKCLTAGLPYSEKDVKNLSIAARRAKRIIHRRACGKRKCCDECLLLVGILDRFFDNEITGE